MIRPGDIVMEHSEKRCLSCGCTHRVYTVLTPSRATFKKHQIKYTAMNEFCDDTGGYWETDEERKLNRIAMEDAYHEAIRQ